MRKMNFANPKRGVAHFSARSHRPPHIFEDNAFYFITGRTYFGFPYLKDNKIKKYFLEKIDQTKSKYDFELQGWVVLDNHYHLLVKFGVAQFIARFIKELHGSTSHFIRRINSANPVEPDFAREFYAGLTPFEQRQWEKLNRKINFASPVGERRLKSATPEKLGLAHFSARQLLELKPPPVWYQYLETIIRSEADFYRYLNYIHQNPVKHGHTKDMGEYQFSSYGYYLKEKGKDWLADCFREYPIIDFEPKGGAD